MGKTQTKPRGPARRTVARTTRKAPRAAARSASPSTARSAAKEARQITVRGIDNHLDRLLKEEAERMSTSVNQLALRLLRQALGLAPSPPPTGYDDLDALAGTWSEDDARSFEDSLRQQRKVDAKQWK